jgi:predicted transposase YdaD
MMLGLGDLTKTKFYQEAFEEGEVQTKLATIRRLSRLNLPVDVIAKRVETSVVEVQRVLEQGDEVATGN